MKRKYIRIFLLFTIATLLFAGYIKGCNSTGYPKQLPIAGNLKDSLGKYTPNLKDSIIEVPVGAHYKKNELHELIYGIHNRDLWALPVKMKVFDIGTEKGGFKIIKKGGNLQTLSLRLENPEGKKYVLRTVDKDQGRILPPLLQNKAFVFLIRDQTAALNPYAALVLPKLEDAAGIMHSNPELFFVPYDKRFGKYTDLFEGRVVLLEEYPDESWAGTNNFKGSINIIGTQDMLQQRFKYSNVAIDQKAFIKARFFDFVINDWDRHSDQWVWAEYSEGEKTIFRPVPRDRDIAFYKFNTGLIPNIVLIINNKFQSFDYQYGNIHGLVKNAKHIDRLLLNSLSKEDFTTIAKELQSNLTDQVIEEAIKMWPPEVYELAGRETISKLKTRRNNLLEAVHKYYKILFEEVNIAGTDGPDYFFIRRMNDNQTSVTIKNESGNISYEHVFNHDITEEINLYGLKGYDEFIIEGQTKKGIIINVYGGEDYDKIKDYSFVNGFRKKTRIFDNKDNEIEMSEETEDNTSTDPDVFNFNRTGRK